MGCENINLLATKGGALDEGCGRDNGEAQEVDEIKSSFFLVLKVIKKDHVTTFEHRNSRLNARMYSWMIPSNSPSKFLSEPRLIRHKQSVNIEIILL